MRVKLPKWWRKTRQSVACPANKNNKNRHLMSTIVKNIFRMNNALLNRDAVKNTKRIRPPCWKTDQLAKYREADQGSWKTEIYMKQFGVLEIVSIIVLVGLEGTTSGLHDRFSAG